MIVLGFKIQIFLDLISFISLKGVVIVVYVFLLLCGDSSDILGGICWPPAVGFVGVVGVVNGAGVVASFLC